MKVPALVSFLTRGVGGQVRRAAARAEGVSWPAWAKKGSVGFGARRVGLRGGLPCRLGCDASGQPLVGALGVVDVVERVDLGLQLGQRVGEWLLVEVAEQGLVEAFVLALGGRLVRLAGDRLDAQARRRVPTSWPRYPRRDGFSATPLSDSSRCGHAVGGDGLVEDRDRGLGGLTPRDVGGDRVAGVVVDELEDHALASAGQHVLGRVELPARVRCRVDEPAPRRAGLLLRLEPGDAGLAEDPRQRRRSRAPASRPIACILSCTLIGPWSSPEASSAARTCDRLLLDLVGQLRRARPRPPGPGLEHRRRPVGLGALAQLVERLARDAVLGAERRDRAARRVVRPLRDRETDTGIDGFIGSHRRSLAAEVSPPRPPRSVTDVLMQNCHRCPAT